MNYSVIDVETTGSLYKNSKIIEIAIVNISDGKIVETYSTLINPERRIPYFITQLTGINDQMVESAPKFYEVAKKIVELTKDRIFIAHNVHFDFSFIQKEFSDLGYQYKRDKICTVRLARKNHPNLISYKLKDLCSHFNINLDQHHRALSDATSTAELFLNHLNLEIIPEKLNLPPQINKSSLDELPENCGVYFIYNSQNEIIYIGKSKNIKKRIYQHFKILFKSSKEIEFKNSITDIKYELTGSEPMALIIEDQLISEFRPRYNRTQKRRLFPYGIYLEEDDNGYLDLKVKKIHNDQNPDIFCSNRKSGNLRKEAILKKIYPGDIEQLKSILPSSEYNSKILSYFSKQKLQDEENYFFLPGRSKNERAIIKTQNSKLHSYTYCTDQENKEELTWKKLDHRPKSLAILIKAIETGIAKKSY